MFGISMWEIMIVLLVLFVLVGPAKIPELAKTLGKALGNLRKSVDEVKKEVNLEEELELIHEARNFSVYDLLEDKKPKKQTTSDLKSKKPESIVASAETEEKNPSEPVLTPSCPRHKNKPLKP